MTTPDQRKSGRSGDELLAGEYVLGVLSENGRRLVEARMRKDRQFAAIVRRWEKNLADFDDGEVFGVTEDIVRSGTLFPARRPLFSNRSGRRGGLWNSLVFWRLFSLVSLLLALGYGLLLQGLGGRMAGSATLVAELGREGDPVSLIARYDATRGRLIVAPVAASADGEKSLEIWLVSGRDKPRSLGTLPQSGSGELIVPANLRQRIASGATLSVSIEPYGGSSTGQMAGPVVAQGEMRMPQ